MWTLYPTRGSIGFKTYSKDKPIKYGLNFQSLGSARKAYVYYNIPYRGKPEVITEAYIGDTLTLVKRIIKDTKNRYPLRGSNLFMDRY